ncbi:MAG: hypothetical protein OEM38_01900 [Gammaproteobacteria bacterium]|nr:hypothetical protein [Gammaproteobacteria bacterium]
MQTQTESINAQPKQIFYMSKKAQELAKECVTKKSLLIALSENQCFSDAIMFLSYAMPYQKGLQWALKCVKNNNQTINNRNALEATEKWLKEPNEENREKILPTEAIAKPTAATWLTIAAYWSGGGINDTPVFESAPNGLVNDSIYSSVMLSVQEIEKNKQLNAYSEVINQGIKILYT